MLRRLVVRLIALLLILNGLAGLGAVWFGWGYLGTAMAEAGELSAVLAPQQQRMIERVRAVGTVVGDAADATDGFARSMSRAHAAVGEGGQAANDLAGNFDRLGPATSFEMLGQRPLEAFAEPFTSSAASFRRLSAALTGTADSLSDNARDTARVAEDLRQARVHLDGVATNLEAFSPDAAVQRVLAGLAIGLRGLLALVLLQGVLSILTGFALLLLAGAPREHAEPVPVAA